MSKRASRTGTTKHCGTCGKDIYSPANRPKKFCGLACRDVAVRARRVRDGEARCARCRTWKPIDEFVKGVNGRPHSYCKPCSSEWFHERRGTPIEKRKVYVPAYRLTEEEKKANKREVNHRQHQLRRAGGAAPKRGEIDGLWCLQHGRCAYCQKYLGNKYHVDHKTPVTRSGTNELSNLHLTCPRCNMVKGTMTHEEFLVSKKRPVVSWDSDTDELDILAATIEALS